MTRNGFRMIGRPASQLEQQTWRTFLSNHLAQMASMDFLTVRTATFRVLFVFVVLLQARRRIVHFAVTELLRRSERFSNFGKRFTFFSQSGVTSVPATER